MDRFKELGNGKKIGLAVAGIAGIAAASYAVCSHYWQRGKEQNSGKNEIKSEGPRNLADERGELAADPSNKSEFSGTSRVPTENIYDEPEEKISAQIGAEKKVLVLGLERSGKTCLLSALSHEEPFELEYKSTQGFNVVCITSDDLTLSIWESK